MLFDCLPLHGEADRCYGQVRLLGVHYGMLPTILALKIFRHEMASDRHDFLSGHTGTKVRVEKHGHDALIEAAPNALARGRRKHVPTSNGET